MNRIEALTNYYTSRNEDARLRSKHGMVEFLTTVHYIEKYLKRLTRDSNRTALYELNCRLNAE